MLSDNYLLKKTPHYTQTDSITNTLPSDVPQCHLTTPEIKHPGFDGPHLVGGFAMFETQPQRLVSGHASRLVAGGWWWLEDICVTVEGI